MVVEIVTYQYPENITGVVALLNHANSYTGYMMGPVFLFAVFILSLLTFMSTQNDRTPESITASLWITTVFGLFLSLVPNMLDTSLVAGLIIATAMSTLLLWWAGKS